MSVIKVVGIDASLNNFGVAMTSIDIHTLKVTLDNVFVIQPAKIEESSKRVVRKNSDDLRRAKWLQSQFISACAGFDLVTAEMPFGSQSARAMASYGICIGVLASCPLPMIEVTPMEVKLAGYGTKTATKTEMIEWAINLHPNANWRLIKRNGVHVPTKDNEHAADALASVYAALDTQQFQMAAAMMRRLSA